MTMIGKRGQKPKVEPYISNTKILPCDRSTRENGTVENVLPMKILVIIS